MTVTFNVKRAVLGLDSRYRFTVAVELEGPLQLIEPVLVHRSGDYEAAKAALAEVSQALGCPAENPMES